MSTTFSVTKNRTHSSTNGQTNPFFVLSIHHTAHLFSSRRPVPFGRAPPPYSFLSLSLSLISPSPPRRHTPEVIEHAQSLSHINTACLSKKALWVGYYRVSPHISLCLSSLVHSVQSVSQSVRLNQISGILCTRATSIPSTNNMYKKKPHIMIMIIIVYFVFLFFLWPSPHNIKWSQFTNFTPILIFNSNQIEPKLANWQTKLQSE